MKALVRLVDGMQFVGDADSGHSIVMDGDHEVGGRDTGLRPSELLLLGIGGCSGMDIISILRKKQQDVVDFYINVVGNKTDSHPKYFKDITLEYVVKGHNISEEAVKRAVFLSMTKYCSVKATLEGKANINFTYKIIQA